MTEGPGPADPGAEDPSGVSLLHLAATVLADLSRVARGEAALARAELRAALRRIGTGFALAGVALVTGIVALVMLAEAAAAGLHAAGLPPLVAALVTGLALLVLAVLCGIFGLRRLSPAGLIPRRALRNLRRDGETLFGKVDENARSHG